MGILNDVWKGHILAFERPLQNLPSGGASQFLMAFLVTAGPLLWASRQLLEPSPESNSPGVRLVVVLALTVASLVVTRLCIGSRWHHLGLRLPVQWTRREVLYAAQVVPIASVAFFLAFRPLLADLIMRNGVLGFLGYNVLFGIVWGFYQEFTYRGLLQHALSTRFGPTTGILVANAAFTFGPLHASAYSGPAGVQSFVPIFVVGLIFGLIFQRSGNLWLPAIFHGLWPLNMAG